MNLHFLCGLPRSGSTLLAAILRQNPNFSAGMSSPVAGLYSSLETAMAQKSEGAIFVTDQQRKRVLKGCFESFYGQTDGVVFDTNRMWLTRLPALVQLWPNAKFICCVRDLAWIIDSFERLQRRNAFEPSGIYGFNTGTVYSRCAAISSSSGVVGYSLDALREAMAGDEADRLLIVEYEDLCRNTSDVLGKIYRFIDEPRFLHDYTHVEYSASEFDRNIGAKGLHDIGGKVEWKTRKTILPPDLFARYTGDQFWRLAA